MFTGNFSVEFIEGKQVFKILNYQSLLYVWLPNDLWVAPQRFFVNIPTRVFDIKAFTLQVIFYYIVYFIFQ